MNSNSFLSISNYDKCFYILSNSLADKFQYAVPPEKEEQIKKTLYFCMKERTVLAQDDMKMANQTAIKAALEQLSKQMSLTPTNKPTFRNLDREKMVYGEREVSTLQFKPHATSIRDGHNTEKSFELIVAERGETTTAKPQPSAPKSTKDDSLDISDFNQRLSMMENARVDSLREIIPQTKPSEMDVNELYKKIMGTPGNEKSNITVLNPVDTPAVTFNQHDIIQRATPSIEMTKYIVINGFDRDWALYPNRFRFSVNMADLSRQYRNITCLKVTSIILPMEIVDTKTLTNIPKNSYLNSFKMSFPYFMCCIDEINDVYDGLNSQARRSFTNFVFENSFRDDNGRGYAVLCPMQREEKTYHPNPLSSLQRLSISIQKPNGALFNQSRDDYMIQKIEYEDYNKPLLKIVIKKFYDKNEFYVGDTVMIKGVRFTKKIMVQGREKEDPYPGSNYNELTSFLNRSEGHEIIEIGQPNQSGYYLNFYIQAPRRFDEAIGKYTILINQVEALRTYNIDNPITPTTKDLGSIINMSLQPVISLSLRVATGDAGIVRSELI